MSQYITTHDATGTSIFTPKIPDASNAIAIPGGTMSIIYTSHQGNPNLSTEADIDQLASDRITGLANGSICPNDGFAAAIIGFQPNAESPFHRTMTLDTLVITEGVVELQLENGEARRLKAGDSVVQRATLHKWRNVTPDNGWAKMMAVAHSIASPVEIGGKTLTTEYRM